jgi:hypothetical protein
MDGPCSGAALERRWLFTISLPVARRCLLAFTLLVAADAALAWGPVGHRAIGAVADDLLTPAARAAVAELMVDDRDRDDKPSGRHTLADVASWPDEIRGGPADRPHWHYDNRPICADPGRPWCNQGDCATGEIPQLLAIVGDRSRPRRERNEALKWIVHLVGDIHMPLHAADFAQGGGLIHVRRHGPTQETETLHYYWDVTLVAMVLHPHDGVVPVSAQKKLEDRARAEDPALVAAAPDAWSAESNALARSVALDISGIGCDIGADARHYPTVNPTPRYIRRAKPVVEERLALAGARLAYVLNQRLGAAQ